MGDYWFQRWHYPQKLIQIYAQRFKTKIKITVLLFNKSKIEVLKII